MTSYQLSNDVVRILRRVVPLPRWMVEEEPPPPEEVACALLEGLLQVRLLLSTEGRSDVVVPCTCFLSEPAWATCSGSVDGAGVLAVGLTTCGGAFRVAATLGLVAAVLGEDAPVELRALATVATAEGLVGAVTRGLR